MIHGRWAVADLSKIKKGNVSDSVTPQSWLLNLLAILALRDVPFWTRFWWRRALRVPLYAVYVIVIISLILLPFENRLAFPGAWMGLPFDEPKPEHAPRAASRGGRRQRHPRLVPGPGRLDPREGRRPLLARQRHEPQRLARADALLPRAARSGRPHLRLPRLRKSTGKPTEKGGYASIRRGLPLAGGRGEGAAGEIIHVGSSMAAPSRRTRRPGRHAGCWC